MSNSIRIAIVEDDVGVRETLTRIFSAAEGFRVVEASADGESAVLKIPPKTPDVVLMDINLTGMSGIDCLREIKKLLPKVRIVMLTVYDDSDTLFQSLVAGADGFLLKRFSHHKLVESVREIAAGGAPMSPQVARRIVEYFHHLKEAGPQSHAPGASADVRSLTAREQEILAKLAEGLVPKEVASALEISRDTVRNHVTNIYNKLHVHSRAEAILKYLGR